MKTYNSLPFAFMLTAINLVLIGCGDNPSLATAGKEADSSTDAATDWECDTAHAGWERCDEQSVQHCHVVEGMDPHFHWGADCASLGLTCVQLASPGRAACVDLALSCTAAEERCEANTAFFCADSHLAQEPCGTAKECRLQDGTPQCVLTEVQP